jgi:hypothetical protein
MPRTQNQIARSYAIRAKKAAAPKAVNDNAPVRSAYVDTIMTPGMLAACVAASGIGQ